jgi:hypothetical protein
MEDMIQSNILLFAMSQQAVSAIQYLTLSAEIPNNKCAAWTVTTKIEMMLGTYKQFYISESLSIKIIRQRRIAAGKLANICSHVFEYKEK